MSTANRTPAENQLVDYYAKHGDLGHATNSAGNPIAIKDASLTVGKDGPVLLEDWQLIGELQHFGRERIPERVVHAKGGGAFGVFEVTHDITRYTAAKVFSKVGKKTNTAMRFSTVAGNLGSSDTVRDPRGFAVKFYTEDGIWDLTGNNTPIFFIRDAILFPHFIHSQKRNPGTNTRNFDAFWDFISLRPETLHQVMILFSDRGIPDGFRHMHGFGSHTFSMINAKKELTYVKFHFKTDQGIKNIDPDTAEKLAGSDPDYAMVDLYNAIATNNFPSWTLYIQTMTPEQAKETTFNPFDLTKVWPHGDFPLQPVGKITLNRNPVNYFSEMEQLAFSPANLVPGIGASPDRVLQARLFSYHDTHLYRLGANYNQLPVNCPFHVADFERDGTAAFDNQGGAPNYHPNSFGGPNDNKSLAEIYYPYQKIEGVVARYDVGGDDNYSQPRVMYREVLNAQERDNLANNIAGLLKFANQTIQNRTVEQFTKVDSELGTKIEKALQTGARARI